MNAFSLGPFGEDEFKFEFDQHGRLIDIQFIFDHQRNLLDKLDEYDIKMIEEKERIKEPKQKTVTYKGDET